MKRSQYRLISLISAVSATALLACSGSETPDAGTIDTGTTPDTGVVVTDTGIVPDTGIVVDAGMPEDAGVASCLVEEQVDTTPDPGCNSEWVVTIGGQLQTGAGVGIDDARAQVCVRTEDDTLTCLRPKETCQGGQWEVLLPDFVRCAASVVMHNFALDLQFADTYCRPGIAGLGPRVMLADPIKLYATTLVANIPPEGDRTAARTLTFQGDLEVDVTPDKIFFGYEELAAVQLAGDVSPLPCFVSASDNFDKIYGFSPSINIEGPTGFPFKVNATGLAEGTTVDLFVLGGLDCRLTEDPVSVVEEAHWESYATAVVAADGSISGDLPCFNWFAYKAQ